MAKSSQDRAAEEIFALRREIDKHNHQYYVLDNPLVSDPEYDRLFRRLVELELAHPELAAVDSTLDKLNLAKVRRCTRSPVSVFLHIPTRVRVGGRDVLSGHH
jgi:NAD-dependent DNA ligase